MDPQERALADTSWLHSAGYHRQSYLYGLRLKREGLTSATRCMSWVAAERLPIRRTRWTSTILWPIAGRLAHRSPKRGATFRRTLMAPTTYGCRAGMRLTV